MKGLFARKKVKSPDSDAFPPDIGSYHADHDSLARDRYAPDADETGSRSSTSSATRGSPGQLSRQRTNSGGVPNAELAGDRNVHGTGGGHGQAHVHAAVGVDGAKPAASATQQTAVISPANNNNTATAGAAAASGINKPKLVFHCQQAQGSPTGLISGFTSVRELYQKIAECYDMDPSQILFCTLNTHKVDMGRLLGGQIGLDDFIFAHVKGQAKEIEIIKEEDALGLTITDNGAGYAFIKRIKEGSLMDKISHVSVGDHIEKINQQSLVGCRHFEVARKLKDIPRGSTFTVRLIEPLKAGFAAIGPRSAKGAKAGSGAIGTGKATLRLRAKGPATVEEAPDVVSAAVTEKINGLLESFLGINDIELATTIWEIGQGKTNTHDFALALDGSELAVFGFTDDFVFDLWGIISDAKSGRLKADKPKFEMQL
ncbi:PDZ domain-containing protein GIPC2-like [Paramacrobiotus metropolitanus]|uniref:PDZ domain-containing protein GIPC2-like n=1 Tax=Paramacrobiotus metropolitanus TaxID=2943436 RepID=UPI002445B179|nr:PDZ domain-containing protein GIPC2-like [Paramacrobiotus metropolitanus]XP_055327437.1 PDZ domain-containing protein GIPC2-like [Paramacrobiotus metropolitanus]